MDKKGLSLKNKKISLGLKINFILAVAATLLLVSIARYEYTHKKTVYEAQWLDRIEKTTSRMSSSLSYPLWIISKSEVDIIASLEMSSPDLAYMEILDGASQTVIVRFNENSAGELRNIKHENVYRDKTRYHYRERAITFQGKKIAHLTLGFVDDHIKREVYEWLENFLWFSLGLLLVFLVLLSNLMHFFVIKPLNILQHALQHFEDEPAEPVKNLTHRQDEIGKLANSLLIIRENLLVLLKDVDHKIKGTSE